MVVPFVLIKKRHPMKRYLCIHGHFYQPPRENPWLEEVELQDSAHPFHDWNDRISAECYAPNTASRILGADRRIIDLSNNYTRISYNFGPTLLSWMQRNDPRTYRAIIDADHSGRRRFSGHGPALAQSYNHIIVPLANSRDKRTQILWGIRDFEHRYGRRPEGMWLAETAVDHETLDIMAEFGIRFTILAPRQAKQTRRIDQQEWNDVSGGRIDPRRAYRCKLPSGRSIALFFYDGPIAQDIAFGGILDNGEHFANRLIGTFSDHDEPQLVHVATDGETYGHHHRKGDMALAYCLYHMESIDDVSLTIYGEFLDRHPPTYEVEIYENSSWSCIHGVERWRSNCGCNSGMKPGWSQQWRSPLRGALDWLRDSLILLFESQSEELLKDPWRAREDYIRVILDRSKDSVRAFLADHAVDPSPSDEQTQKILKLMEIQRNAMLMYTSCGWFFDEVTGIETVQVMAYAARAIQLAKQVADVALDETFHKLLELAPSNIPEYKNAGYAYEHFVKPSVLDLVRVGAHYAVSSVFEEYAEDAKIYSYEAKSDLFRRDSIGRLRFTAGRVLVRSDVTYEERTITFTAMYFGDHNLAGGVREFIDNESFENMYKELHETFMRSDVPGTISLIEKHFGSGSYSLWHLFKDEQRKILGQILDTTLSDVELSLRQIENHHYSILDVMRQMNIPLPRMFARIAEMIHDADIQKELTAEQPNADRLKRSIVETRRWSLEPDRSNIAFTASKRINTIMEAWSENPVDRKPLVLGFEILDALAPLHLSYNFWIAQNIYFTKGRQLIDSMKKRAAENDPEASDWISAFNAIGIHLNVKVL